MKKTIDGKARGTSKPRTYPQKDNYSQNSRRRTYKRFRDRPDVYLREILSDITFPVEIDEITDALYHLTEMRIRNKTLLRIVKQYEEKHGAPLLVEVEGQSNFYNLKKQ